MAIEVRPITATLGAEISGVGDDETDVSLSDDLRTSVNTVSGGRIVGSFVNNFMRSVLSGGGFDASSILSLTFTQPLLAGFGERIVREPLTQAERDVVYQVRDFERFRTTFAVQVISDYYGVVQEIRDLASTESNLANVRTSRACSCAGSSAPTSTTRSTSSGFSSRTPTRRSWASR